MLKGPRRAQAQEQVAQRFGPIRYTAHAVTSRVTSWAASFHGEEIETLKATERIEKKIHPQISQIAQIK